MDQNSEQVTVSSGQDVFFISSDAKEWIYVRAKDGTEGYIHVDGENVSNVGRPGTEVFSELNYFDQCIKTNTRNKDNFFRLGLVDFNKMCENR